MPDDSHPVPPSPVADARATVLAYHERTKHRLERYAAGPETLDWSAQPDPFRHYEGAERRSLALTADALATLQRARRIALANGLAHVYTGNVHDREGGATA